MGDYHMTLDGDINHKLLMKFNEPDFIEVS